MVSLRVYVRLTLPPAKAAVGGVKLVSFSLRPIFLCCFVLSLSLSFSPPLSFFMCVCIPFVYFFLVNCLLFYSDIRIFFLICICWDRHTHTHRGPMIFISFIYFLFFNKNELSRPCACKKKILYFCSVQCVRFQSLVNCVKSPMEMHTTKSAAHSICSMEK